MNLSIITPHKNNFEGLLSIYDSLINQISQDWKWIIIDDNSDEEIRNKVSVYFKEIKKVEILFNKNNLGPSRSRNKGVKETESKTIVFLDSDDLITSNFVSNRLIPVGDFVVFSNMMITDEEKSYKKRFSDIKSDFLKSFLQAKFPWQTTAVLWDKTFFKTLNGFDTSLKLLEDIELSIRALIVSENYKVLTENEIDFYYKAKPINVSSRPFYLVVDSVEKLIINIKNKVSSVEINYLSNYYYLSIRYFLREGNSELTGLKKHLLFFKNQKIINIKLFFFGNVLLLLFPILGKNLFLRINRKIFKKI